MVELGEYALEPLRKDEEFILYRGKHRSKDDAEPPSVLLLTPVLTRPALQSVKKMEHEYSLRDDLDTKWAVRPLDLSQYNGQKVLVLGDPGGEPLHRLIQGRMEIRQFLRIAIGLAAALGQLHKRKLIHKDVKPSNVLVDSATGQVWLTGFGIASRLPRERPATVPHEFIAGTLAYMAPEQTGRMNRPIDSRSDLYALGVTLYEMLTGTLPFTASDPMELMHCHIARQPTPPCDRLNGVPGMVSAIIMKLLAKTAEERYQTAVGVERDIRLCLEEWEAHHRIGEFALCGEYELLIPEKLYGRDREVEMLLTSFDRIVKSGAAELVLVSGDSGVGKSSVVHELHKLLVPPHGLFASGKFDQYKGDIPYATLAQAFQSLLRPLLTKSEEELGKWRDTLREALDPNGQLIVDLVPELKLIIGKQPPVPPLPLQDAQRRFQLVFRRFIGVFARPEHPLALFLDDLQWLDAATLDLIEDLLTQSDVLHLMLIGAYRDNEVHSAHPLMRKLEAIRKAGGIAQEIVLAPLSQRDLAQLIADSLHCETERATPLARLVHDKTAGNPFFAIQFIYALAEEGLLSFKHGERRWLWDLDGIHAKGYADNVVDLMVGKLNRLPEETQSALQQLACLGNSAEFSTIQKVYHESNERMHSRLWEAVKGSLIFRSEDSYKFLHDRVQEAAYSLIPQELRAETHLRIGRLLATNTPPEKREEAIFEIVNHLNRGAVLITSREERDRLAELNLIAGKRARASTAYATALNYLVAGAAMLDDSWERRHGLTFEMEFHRAECEFLTGQSAAAEERLTVLSSRAANTVELATVACLRVDLYMILDQSDRAVAVGLDYLRHLGVEWPAHPTEEEGQREYERIWSKLGSRTIEQLTGLPLMSDPAFLATLGVLTKVLPPALFTDANLLSLAVCRAVNLSLERGNSDGSCVAYAWLGQIAGPKFGNYKAGFQFGRLGYELVEKRGLKHFEARTYMVFGSHVVPWTKHVRAGRDLIRRTLEAANKIGDLCFAAYSYINLNTNLLAAGDPLVEAQREAEKGLEFAQKARFGLAIDFITLQLGLIRTLRGLTPKFGCFDDAKFEELRFERHLASSPALAQPECHYWIRRLQARFLAGDYASALDASLRAEPLLSRVPSNLEMAEYHLYGGLTRAAFWDSATPDQKQHHLEALRAHQRQLQIWAENCAENFENRAALVGAEIARIEGRPLEAQQLYEQAIRSARANGFVHNEALANELAARFYSARGFEKIAYAYLQDARYGYLRWGASGKVRQLDELYPQLREEKQTLSSTSTIDTSVEHLDLATVIKVSQAVSGEMVLEKLIDTLMRIAIEHAGAERGLLVLPRGGELRIEAEATTGGAGVIVRQREAAVSALPESIVHFVTRTQECVILGDAATHNNPFSADTYIRQRHARSILCLPLMNQAKLVGVLYLENNLAPHAFTPTRITVLKLLASQAAVSLENTRLYVNLEEREAKIRRLVDANIMGIFIWNLEGKITEANEAFLHMVEYDREDLASGRMRWTDLTPVEWQDRDARALADLKAVGTAQPYEKEFFRKHGSRVPVLAGGALFEEGGNEGVAFVLDLSEQKRAEEALRRSEQRWQTAFENSAIGMMMRNCSDRFIASNSVFQNMLGYTESELSQLSNVDMTYDEDRRANLELIGELLEGRRQHFQIEKRYRRKDGTLLWVRNNVALIPGIADEAPFLFAVVEDITQRKQEESARRYSEERYRIVVETASDAVVSIDESSTILFVNPATSRIFGYDASELIGRPLTTLMPDYMRELHNAGFKRYLDSAERHINWQGTELIALRKNSEEFPVEVSFGELVINGRRLFTGFIRDITERKRAEEALRSSEAYLAEAQRVTHTGSWASDGTTHAALYWSEEMFRIFGFDPQQGLPMRGQWLLQRIHPEDLDRVKREASDRMFLQKVDSDVEFRIVLPDGTVKHIHGLAHPVLSPNGELVKVVGTAIDVTERKRAEEKILQSEKELRQLLDFTPQHVTVLGPDRSRLYNNRAALDYHGLTLEEWQTADPDRLFHPQDWERLTREVYSKFLSGSSLDIEVRLRRRDGQYRWFLIRYNPTLDEQGRPTRWYAAATDIEDRKQAEQRLHDENVALREEIDRASMFEEIVGISPALHAVLSRVSKVAPTDSTVLITGETGTGKELIARAIHRRSHRSSRAFVNVNCAAVPRDLIASELFGHEKGAFTGATQRRLGRFELAEGGTIFLDEIGELPAETQIALLRVLQEHEFGRVGGTGSLRTNVRVIAATNRNLEAAIAAGTFRSDLFYRLNVFPIEVPPLRERKEDIPVLVEYFIERYASKAGKSIRGVNKKSLELLQSYPWPGNIRELQNVIERSVIVCETENFSVDESWLSRRPIASEPKTQLELARKPAAKEKEIIEAALRESGGRVYGPSGAASKLGIPRSTLESKIRSLKINKSRFKAIDSPENS